MASSLISNHNFLFKCPSSSSSLNLPKAPCSMIKWNPDFSSSRQRASHLKLLRITNASSEDVPSELIEDSKFVPLNPEDPTYGPPALLLLGFQVEEAAQIQRFLKELDGEFLEVIFCTEDMINRSLWEAMNTKQSNLDASKVATSLPRICFFSGLTGEEMMMFIDDFPKSGLEPPIFAALVPNSADKPLSELIEEIMGDHEMLTASQAS